MIFYVSLFIFISSLIAGLVIMIAGKGMNRGKFLLLSAIHAIFLFAFLASLLLRKNSESVVYNYFFMIFICSGLALSGIAWRSDSPFFLRIYFSFFALTIPLFIFSPSMLLNFLLTMNYGSSNGPAFHLVGKYYIEKQNTTLVHDDIPHYKVIIRKGLFHQTVQRDLLFGGKLDSIKVLDFENGKSLQLRGYTSKITYVSTDVDSTDVTLPLMSNKPDNVEYHL